LKEIRSIEEVKAMRKERVENLLKQLAEKEKKILTLRRELEEKEKTFSKEKAHLLKENSIRENEIKNLKLMIKDLIRNIDKLSQ
ncbi:MAG: hypothetical protein DRP81_08825, partial [Candidatus Omnitrophota bacterium]